MEEQLQCGLCDGAPRVRCDDTEVGTQGAQQRDGAGSQHPPGKRREMSKEDSGAPKDAQNPGRGWVLTELEGPIAPTTRRVESKK